MKAAIISDIHGNFQALESVMQDIEKNNCDKIFCLGDLALAGPQPGVVVDYVMQHPEWEIIQGNTDQLISDFNPEIFRAVKELNPLMANALVDEVSTMDSYQKEFLGNLPPQMELDIEGLKVLLVHGSPRVNNEDIWPDMPLDLINEMLENTDADIIFCGHTHIPCAYTMSTKQTIMNVGSIGRPMTRIPLASYIIANFDHGNVSFAFRRVDYDRDVAAYLLSQRNFEGANEIARMLLDPASARKLSI